MNRRKRKEALSLLKAVRISETQAYAQIDLLNSKIRELEHLQRDVMDKGREAMVANVPSLSIEDIKIASTFAKHQNSNCRMAISILHNQKSDCVDSARSLIVTRIILKEAIQKLRN